MKNYPFIVEYEDNHLICVNKKSGVLVQGDHTKDKPLSEYVKEYLKEKYEKPGNVFAGVIHRIDRPVSGLVILAKTSKGLRRMNDLLRDKKMYKTYWAITKRRPKEESGKLIHYLQKDGNRNVSTAFEKPQPDTLKAELTYRILGKLNDHFLWEIHPITGRPHQIRVQLSTIGCPIRGDIKYGFSKPNADKGINLHSRELRFDHPIKEEEVFIQGGLPTDDFWEQFLVLDRTKKKDIDLLLNNK